MSQPCSPSLAVFTHRLKALFISLLMMLFLLASTPLSSAQADDVPTRSARVIYHFVEPDQLSETVSFADRESTISSVCSGEVWQDGDRVLIRANAHPALMDVSCERFAFRVIKDYASTSANGKGAQDITSEASYNAEDGTVSLPISYAQDDLTVAWYVPSELQASELPLQINISKDVEGISSSTKITHRFKADQQTIDITLFDEEQTAARIQDIKISQGGRELSQYVYQNGSISLSASPLGGPIDLVVSDGDEVVTSSSDTESAFTTEPPLISLFSAANPIVGERFALSADSALIRTCEPGGNMARVMGWPEKSGTYGFAVHFNQCVNPEVVNADQNHVAPGGTVHTPGGGTYDYNWVRGMHFAWGECYGNVDDNGTGEPKVQSGWVEVTNVDYATQTVSYRYFLDVCSDIDGHDMQSIMGTFQVHENLVGYIKLQKQSALAGISDHNDCYSLAGARYGIYSDAACTDLKETLTTDAQGCARSKALPVGTYYIKELSTPAGFALDTNAHEIAVAAGVTRELTLDEVPQSDPTPLLLAKHDADYAFNSEHNTIQGGASSFKDAEFTIRFYPTLEGDYAKVEPLRTWVVKTDEHGLIDLRKGEDCKISGDPFFADTNGAITLALGTYEIRETKAPSGYKLNEAVVVRTVTGSPNAGESVSSYDTPIISDPIIRGGLELEKRDVESGAQSALGAATLDGTTFTIVNENSHDVSVAGIFYKPGEVCATLVVKDGKANIKADMLPYGDYTLRETSAGDGYTTSDSKPRAFSIEHDGQIVRFADNGDGALGGTFKNQVKRGDINFIKVRESTAERLKGVPFKITSNTTGESHIVVSDANGIVNTSSEWIEHTHHTNENDEGSYEADRGIWFGKTPEGTYTEARNELGALPFDTYTLEELPCEANNGLELVKSEFCIYRDKQQLDFGVIENHDPDLPWITTSASDSSDHDKLLDADVEATINDHVRYGNLKQGQTYTLCATLVDKGSGDTIEGAKGETTFTATNSSGTTEVSIPVQLLDQDHREIVVYETLLQDDKIILEHNSIDNSEQTVSVIEPRIATTAVDAADGDHEILNGTNAQIVDTVHFANLIPGKEYKLVGTLMRKNVAEDGSIQAVELNDAQNAAIVSENTFTPQTSSGSVEVPFTFDASELEPGCDLVVFERLYRDDNEVTAHLDPQDENQTVRIIKPDEPLVPTSEEPLPTPDDPHSDEPGNFFAKTGSSFLPWLIGFATLFSGALALICLAYRQHRKARAVTTAIAQNMLGTHHDRRP